MRSSCVLLTALVALAAYYIYIPLPSSVSDPWKLMLLDATFRSAQQVSNLIHYLGLSHHLLALNFIIVSFGKKSAWSSPQVKVTDTDFDGVEVRVFEGSPKPEEPLKRGIVYIHGGGWALASAKIRYYDELCTTMAEELNAVIVSIEIWEGLVSQVTWAAVILEQKTWSHTVLCPELASWSALDSSQPSLASPHTTQLTRGPSVQFYNVGTFRYRLVPKVYFPAQIHDVVCATKYFLQPEVLHKYSVDPGRVGISGDSAGGNLAAALGQQFAQDANLKNKLKVQALIYPVLQALDFNTPSYQQNVNTPILPRYVMVKCWVDYFKGNYDFIQAMIINNHTSMDMGEAVTLRARLNWTSLLPASITKDYKPVVQPTGNARIVREIPQLLDVRSAPLIADQEVLRHLPKTYILTCEHDVLRDDGIMYAKRLESAGVAVTLDHFEDGFHGCMIFTSWPTNFSVGIRTRNSYIKWLDQNL
ncbi:neutral cholesterol ester hydrolase 1 isoform X1 [Suricata suricatta]|uniref:neutral cholesterol ester hydrolase 1 isoform X1 n=1 Tax=Suricata suricatta TaxID=37032 RepID=UPI001155FAA0|nr:neutral cholesterol ester hydrolase 1 isoform X1 [Suricata suricatta]